MLDVKLIRDNPDLVKQSCANKGDHSDIDYLLELDSRNRGLITKADNLKSRRNVVSSEIAILKKNGNNADDMIREMRQVSDDIKSLDEEIRIVSDEIYNIMLTIPNVAHPSVPVGRSATDNIEVRRNGDCMERDWRPDHLDAASKCGILDFERGSKVAGSGFGYYIGKGAKLERALLNYFLDVNTNNLGYTEILPPFMVNPTSLIGTGQLPKSHDDMYFIEKDNMYLIPTAEVPITNFHADEMLPTDSLPIRYAGYSACFRREAGSYGKDTRGFLRVHQFNKIELVSFCNPDNSYNELERLVEGVEYIISSLGLTYRVLLLCTGDMTFGGSKTYDLEVWSAHEQKWLEVSSCTNFEAFQARRANIRYRHSPSDKPEFVHTLNGSGLATSRIMVAILEQYQQADGSILVPDVLVPYCGFDRIEANI